MNGKGEGGRGEKKRNRNLQVQGHLYQNEPRANKPNHKTFKHEGRALVCKVTSSQRCQTHL